MNLRPNFNGPLAWSLIAIAVVIVSIAMMLPAVLSAAFSPGPEDGVLDEEFVRLMSESDEALATYESRFVGRSAFYLPRVVRAPVRPFTPPPVRTEKTDSAPPPPPPPPPPPRRYEGPDIMAFVGDEVWFTDDTRVRAGQTGDNGVKVMSVQAPWKATLTYRGWEGDVTLFESNLVGLIAGAPPRRGGLPGLVDEPPADDAVDEPETADPEDATDVPASEEPSAAEGDAEGSDEDGTGGTADDGDDVVDEPATTDPEDATEVPEAKEPSAAEGDAEKTDEDGGEATADDGADGDDAVETGTVDAPTPSEPAPAGDTPKPAATTGASGNVPAPTPDKPRAGADPSPPE